MKVTLGAARGFILRPDLWNALYDSLLRLEIPDESHLVGYVDDVAALVTGRMVEQVPCTLGMVMQRVRKWMAEHGFSLALEKREVVVLVKGRVPTVLLIQVEETNVLSNPAIKYLGIMIDTKMSFFEQIRCSAGKAVAGMFAICWLMSNVEGPLSSRHRLLMSAVQSALLYGSGTWADFLRKEV